ncbi:MAG: hypothetical protein KBT27_14960 [Prevotellaceae bacterium]|nr:hypothetical protein [Candidatus Faecinaster equi]
MNIISENEIIAHVIDADTGVIIDELEAGDKIKHKRDEQKRQDHLDKYQENFNEGVRFVKLFDEVLDTLSERLSVSEFRFAVRLAKHVSYDDCILRTNGHGNGKFLDITDISNLLGENYKTTSRIMNGLIKKGVIGKHVTGCLEDPNVLVQCYTCNPYIYMRGTKVEKTILALFEKSGWKDIYTDTEKSNGEK